MCIRDRYKRVPMGLAVGAQTLTRLLDTVFHDVKFQYVFNLSLIHIDVYKRQEHGSKKSFVI